uniref:PSP proline-rich domain-containing protein n=1 Tax=Chrysotila carterae TaxID=13221 RepID=A0A7S4B3X2_CHRCT|mmetsp:Transcript_24818/g.48235  ORF Transcript_24818/g.48235 Transcript_24818/m.48235 type:complete len:316 (+) Transcript_24818:109-1056(+)
MSEPGATDFFHEDDMFTAFDGDAAVRVGENVNASSTTPATDGIRPPLVSNTCKTRDFVDGSSSASKQKHGVDALPFPFMEQECLISIRRRLISDDDRVRLEKVLRELRVPDEEEGEYAPQAFSQSVQDAGRIDYCQSYCVDYVGASNAASAATWPGPVYEQPLHPLIPASEVCAVPVTDGRRDQKRKRTQTFQGRYFDLPASSTAEKTPGKLSPELRALLGIGELEPPPYLFRMQNLGYPPGYFGPPPSQEAGTGDDLKLYGDQPTKATLRAGSAAGPSQPLIDFPGLNVPPPAGANPSHWNWRRPVVQPSAIFR